ncbi:MAG: hypothetical protein CVV44_03755 [Spirochaetae bacterium HGW-Spirochaetae-1]|jgi:AcrR family transcriptional regulator|nr:MAG: hypothetical protein CVV44_03755 [Spirochaetae bacterium HGW-Spirochaetae-1]
MGTDPVIISRKNMKTRARTEEDKLIKKRRLLDSAKKLFSLHGYQGTSVGMITENAGVSTGTFYLYFKSKPEIYRILNIEGIDILHGYIKESISQAGSDAAGRLSAIAGAYFNFYREYREYYDIIAILHLGQEEFFRDTSMLQAVEEKTVHLLSLLQAVIEEGIKSGDFKPVDARKTTTVLWATMDGILLLEKRNVMNIINESLDDIVKESIEMAFRGIIKKKGE